MIERYLPIIIFGCGVGIGGLLTMAGSPVPHQKDSCGVAKVDVKTATAYVLKPPAPMVQQIVVPQKCEAPPAIKEPEPVSQPEAIKKDDTKKHRRYRHHRIRRYWR